ncbi:TIGR01666 family membrane protein [Salinisphaera sp. USBA-960]|uniref:YccS family putative transporter n=1 Tax=Salinisphaera orenii TaxID=856731 RepID=UPI000DBE32E3|nr:TIGR01666 family membrane protein [Salifodinibacter halophilus]NNC25422.1 TIGR01666 family membrane protein [Salifodinibacter halophilus]
MTSHKHLLSTPFKRVIHADRVADALRVLASLSVVVGLAYVTDRMDALIPLTLGVIAGGIAETDDGPRERVEALAVSLGCFATAAFTVVGLAGMPILFALALFAGTFGLVMMGAVSPRYRTIGNATLLLSIYSLIAVSHTGIETSTAWTRPFWLLLGAGTYGLVAVAWNAIIIRRPVRQALAELFDSLGDYVDIKATLFEPSEAVNRPAVQQRLAHANARTVGAMNNVRAALFDRLNSHWSRPTMAHNLRIYIAAQEIHERMNSVHADYRALSHAFGQDDVLYRIKHLIQRIGGRLFERAGELRYGNILAPPTALEHARAELSQSIAEMPDTASDTVEAGLDDSIADVGRNLDKVAARLEPPHPDPEADISSALRDAGPGSLGETVRRFWVALTPSSAHFRQALRLALALVAGYAAMVVFRDDQGAWVLLTTMLVCQSDYSATRQRVVRRVGGTIVGLCLGWALLLLYPAPHIQLLLMIVAAVVFFVTRFSRYAVATAGISVLVLLSFNQVGNGFDLIVPRLVDTLIGSALAIVAMLVVLPDWRERDLHTRLAKALHANSRYLQAIGTQYRQGKHDDLAYRIARRDAHNADAAVTRHIASAQRDLRAAGTDSQRALSVLTVTQALLGRLSTLGAHRGAQQSMGDHDWFQDAETYLTDALSECAEALIRGEPMPVDSYRETALRTRLADAAETTAEPTALIARQLLALTQQLPALRRIGQSLVGRLV